MRFTPARAHPLEGGAPGIFLSRSSFMRSIEIVRTAGGLKYLNPAPVASRRYSWIGKSSLIGRIGALFKV